MPHSNTIDATRPDALVINRTSQAHTLADYYASKVKAGGTYNAYRATDNTMVDAMDGVKGFTVQSQKWSIERGFTTKIESNNSSGDPRAGSGENFNGAALNYSDNMNGRYSKGYVALPGDYTTNTQATDNMGFNPSISDRWYTMNPGFVLGAQSRITISDFTDVGPANGFGPSAQLSRFMQGFQNQKYSSGRVALNP